ncbi:MAG: class I SAM-dependent methyltransferase [Bacteroidota bacterium]
MIQQQRRQIENTLSQLFNETKNDHLKMMQSFSKSIFRPLGPKDFKDVALSISKEQGEDLIRMIKKENLKKIVEFGTSFGISTLYLAAGVLETGGHIITTELIKSKAERAIRNFKKAGVADHIQVLVGDALDTLKDHQEPIDMLLLDGWKDLYWPLFQLLEPNFHANTVIYVDNADMAETRDFLKKVEKRESYQIRYAFGGSVALIRKRS